MSSDFGRGYTLCLLQFVFHEPRLSEDVARHREHGKEAFGVEMWANAASDHLYDLVTGARVPKAQRDAARALRSDALDCGHGFSRSDWTEANARGWLATARELLRLAGDPSTIENAEAIDRGLGLRPERGKEATCREPMPLHADLRI